MSHRAVVAQAQKTRFKLKAMLSFSVSNFETMCFQAGVKLALPYRARAQGEGDEGEGEEAAQFPHPRVSR